MIFAIERNEFRFRDRCRNETALLKWHQPVAHAVKDNGRRTHLCQQVEYIDLIDSDAAGNRCLRVERSAL